LTVRLNGRLTIDSVSRLKVQLNRLPNQTEPTFG